MQKLSKVAVLTLKNCGCVGVWMFILNTFSSLLKLGLFLLNQLALTFHKFYFCVIQNDLLIYTGSLNKVALLLVIFLVYNLLWNFRRPHKGKNSKLCCRDINVNGNQMTLSATANFAVLIRGGHTWACNSRTNGNFWNTTIVLTSMSVSTRCKTPPKVLSGRLIPKFRNWHLSV